MSHVTFYGFASWVGVQNSATSCAWWPSDPSTLNWDATLLIPVDLAATLANFPKAPASIQVDGHITQGGLTTVGPLWPQGNTIGACWLSENYYGTLTKNKPVFPTGGRNYEFTSAQYYDNEKTNRRFYGFHAKVMGVHAGTGMSMLAIWNPGTSLTGAKPAGTWWIDFAASVDASFSKIDATTAVGIEGAVFIDSTTTNSLALLSPKLPPFRGSFAFPRLRREAAA